MKPQPDSAAKQAPELVEEMLCDALRNGCTDLYMVPTKTAMLVQTRAPGSRRQVASLPAELGRQCVARVKVLASLLTYRTSIAQDGAIHGIPGAPQAQFRVAAMPTTSGERLTIRILDNARGPQYLEDLGFDAAVLDRIRALLRAPSGLLILTGPTGCGKTTTIYAMIRDLLRNGEAGATIITVEDPVESEIDTISQTQIRSGEDQWTYAQALRAALRHDVKTLVVGEMRDRDVVNVVLDAALTGHRIITTYHAGDIPSVFARLLHQGFEPFLVAAAVTGVISQRLLPRPHGGVTPVVALLSATDEWREFLVTNPGLTALRNHIRQVPGACLETEIRRRVEAGAVDPSEVRG